MRSQMETMSNLLDSSPTYPFPVCKHINTSATNRQSLAFDSSSSFLSPDSANSVRSPSDAAATLAQQRAKINAAHRISAPALAAVHGPASVHSARLKSAITPLRKISPSSLGLFRPQCTDFSGFSSNPALRAPCPDTDTSLDELSPTMIDSWANMVITPLLPMFQKPSSPTEANNTNAMSRDQTVDLAAAKFNDPYGGTAFRAWMARRSSAGPPRAICTITPAQLDRVNNDVTNDGVYCDDDDLI